MKTEDNRKPKYWKHDLRGTTTTKILDRGKCFWCGADAGYKKGKAFPCVCKDCFFVLNKYRGRWYPLRDGEPIKQKFRLRPHHIIDIMFGTAIALVIVLLLVLIFGGKV